MKVLPAYTTHRGKHCESYIARDEDARPLVFFNNTRSTGYCAVKYNNDPSWWLVAILDERVADIGPFLTPEAACEAGKNLNKDNP